MADNVAIIYGIIYGVYQSASGRMHNVQARENTIKYLTKSNDLELLAELAKQTNKWVNCKYILHMMLWGLRDDCHKDVILQYMSDEQIAVLKDTISVVKDYNCPDGQRAKIANNNYSKKKKTQTLSTDDMAAWCSTRVAIKVADKWDEMVAELNVWAHMIDEFKRDKSKGRKRKEYMQNKGAIRLRHHANYNERRTEILEQKSQYGKEHREEINAKRRQRYRDNPETAREKSRIYQSTHQESVREKNSKYYQEHKAEKAEKAQQRLARLNQQSESAQKVCAAYVFLMNLKRADRSKYLELYTRKQNPLTGILKTCVALQNMDINLCPFCNPNCGNMIEDCCNPKVVALPTAVNELQIIANDLSRQK